MGRSQERIAERIEELIQRHRPTLEKENMPASPIQLELLNYHGLLENVIERQATKDGDGDPDDAERPIRISRLTAWEELSDAQRAGLRIEPRRLPN